MKFIYKARSREGRVQEGTIEASSRKGALDILEKYGLQVTSLKAEMRKGILRKDLVFGRGVSQKNLVVFTRQLGTMLKAAIPPLETFRAQVVQTTSAVFREKVLRMAEAIETGSSLSQAFALHPKIFSAFFVSIIKSGEATGKVADSLNYLADHLEREYNFNQKVKGAMLYPAFVVAVFVASFTVVAFFIVPKLSEILKNFSGDLPLMTRALIWLADFLKVGGWIAVPIVLAGLVVFFFYFSRSTKGKETFYKLSLKVPALGAFYKKIYLSRFGENLSVLITSGLPITQALKITSEIVTNFEYKKALEEAEARVSKGEKISTILNRYPDLFPPFVTQMISTGEETGRLDKILMEMVKFYRADIERSTDKLTSILEPVLILVLGIGIAILAFAVFVPLFNIGMGGAAGV